MESALIGLAGALLGAIAALFGGVLNDRRQARIEAVRWRRDQLANASQQALRYLLRATNRRSKITLKGGTALTVLSTEHQRDWFDDLVEAQVWLRTAATFSVPERAAALEAAAVHLDHDISSLVTGGGAGGEVAAVLKSVQHCVHLLTRPSNPAAAHVDADVSRRQDRHSTEG